MYNARRGRWESVPVYLVSMGIGLLIGLAVFYWWATWGRGIGAYLVDFMAVQAAALTLLAVALLVVIYRFWRGGPNIGTALLFLVGSWAGVALGPFWFPAAERVIPPPAPVKRAVELRHDQLQTDTFPWEARIDSSRQALSFRIKPAHKGLGLLPSSSWVVEWQADYSDGTQAVAEYYVTARPTLRPSELRVTHPGESGMEFDADDLKRIARSDPAQLPWTWALERPAEVPTEIKVKEDTEDGVRINAHYPGELPVVEWAMDKEYGGEVVESTSYYHPGLLSPCMEPWRTLLICVTDVELKY